MIKFGNIFFILQSLCVVARMKENSTQTKVKTFAMKISITYFNRPTTNR
jgi:hypothetical protein